MLTRGLPLDMPQLMAMKKEIVKEDGLKVRLVL